ncbi:MAG: septum formation protein Maf [Nitrospira sp.]|nr:septum formation protein Maf [Nitrospira sp.]
MRLILASTSPRRKELLAFLQVPFEVVAPTFIEHVSQGLAPGEQAELFAKEKSRSCAGRLPGDLVLASDTLIAVDQAIFGKPEDLAEAERMLRRLRGREHLIYTAVALRREVDGVEEMAVETVQVRMRAFSEQELQDYLQAGEGMGKAGGYSIQGMGGRLIERIDGDYTAAVGLPLRLVAELLRKHGLAVPIDVERLYRTKPYPNWERFAPQSRAGG